MARPQDPQAADTIDIVSSTSGNVLTKLAEEDVVGCSSRAVKMVVAEKVGQRSYTQLKIVDGDGQLVDNDTLVTEGSLRLGACGRQLQVCWVSASRAREEAAEAARTAARNEEIASLRQFLEVPHDPNALYDLFGGESLLHAALRDGAMESVRLLLQVLADPNLETADGFTPLAAGLCIGNMVGDTVQDLVRARAAVNARSRKFGGRTALHLAAAEGCSEM